MLRVEPRSVAEAQPTIDPDIACARAWIDGARECGLVVFPWGSVRPDGSLAKPGVMQFGQEMDGPNDYSAGITRFVKHPAFHAVDDCRRDIVFDVLCDELGVDPHDPEFFDKVNAHLQAERESRS